MLRRLILAGVAAVALCGLTRPAAAKVKVAVLPFSGPGASAARAGVMEGLETEAATIPVQQIIEAATDLGVDSGSGRWLVGLCARLGCRAVVTGSVVRTSEHHELVVTVYSGRTAETLARHTFGTRAARHLGLVGRALGRRCLATMSKYDQGDAAPSLPERDPPAAAATGGPAEEKRVSIAKRPVPAKKQPEAGQGSLFDLSIAFGLAKRDQVLQGAGDSPRPDKVYEGTFGEFTLRAGVYPLTPFLKNMINGLGLGLTYSRHLGMGTTVEGADGETVDAASQELLLDLMWRWKILSRSTSPVVTLLAGWGLRDFDLGANEILTSFNYRFFRLGLDGSVPLGTPYAALTAGIDLRPLTQVGPEAVDCYGNRTGGIGFAVRAGASGTYRLPFGALHYYSSFEFVRVSVEFAGLDPSQVRREERRDRDDPTAAEDRLMRFWIGAGYSY
jgi:hypothetical protein